MGHRQRLAPTDDWQQLDLLVRFPEQRTYELIRPVILFGPPKVERHRTLPDDIQRAILVLKAEHPAFPDREIATICGVSCGRRNPVDQSWRAGDRAHPIRHTAQEEGSARKAFSGAAYVSRCSGW